jgi:CheY-like chemotaxis protein
MPNCILIVDDNPTIRHMLRMTFEDISGWAVGEAENGREAIDKARESKPDLIVLDLSMPIMNGLEVAHSQGRVAAVAKRLATVDLLHAYGDTLGSQQLLRPGPHETLRPLARAQTLVAQYVRNLNQRYVHAFCPPLCDEAHFAHSTRTATDSAILAHRFYLPTKLSQMNLSIADALQKKRKLAKARIV